MAAKRFRSALVCAVVGHDWEWHGVPEGQPYRCERCKAYDNYPKVKRAAARRVWLRKWSPLWPTIRKRGASVRIGWAYKPFTACVSIGLHWGWDRTDELPGITAALDVWRLRVSTGIGSGWWDEDADSRSFVYLTGRFQTYGLRYVGCWFGHKPETSEYMPNHVYCARCDAPLRGERESIDAKAAA